MKLLKTYLKFVVFVPLLVSCLDRHTEQSAIIVPAIHDMIYDISLNSFDDAKPAIDSLLELYPHQICALLKVNSFDSLSMETVYELSKSQAVAVFTPDVESLGLSQSEINHLTVDILRNASEQGLKLGANRFATVVWGKPQSILFCDSVMLVALNHYLGADYPGYASLGEYIRRNKSSKALPYDMVEALVATAYPFKSNDSSMVVNRLVYEGALVASRMLLVENSNLPDALGYSEDELNAVETHYDEIWQKILSDKMLFDTDMSVADRLLNPAPYSGIISTHCPGRVGRYIGYRIVQSYLDANPKATLKDILDEIFYNSPNPLELALSR